MFWGTTNFENTNRRKRQLEAHRDYSSTANWQTNIPAIFQAIFGIFYGPSKLLFTPQISWNLYKCLGWETGLSPQVDPVLNQLYVISANFSESHIHNKISSQHINLLKPNDIYICHTAVLTSRRYILNIYLTNMHTEYFKHAA